MLILAVYTFMINVVSPKFKFYLRLKLYKSVAIIHKGARPDRINTNPSGEHL